LQKGSRTADVSHKFETKRYAVACGRIRLPKEIIEKIKDGGIEKGDVLSTSELAGLLGAKKVPELIPFCHPIPIDRIEVTAHVEEWGIKVEALVSGVWRTGYEMEALTAVSIALLNIYDMCKPYTQDMVIEEVKLVEKGGGKSEWFDDLKGLKAAVITVSDSAYQGKTKDLSGPAVSQLLKKYGATIIGKVIVPDDEGKIKEAILQFTDKANIIVTTGGTGVSPRDVTPEASSELIGKELPGLSEAMRIFGVKSTPRALLSRAKAGIINENCILINLPGSVRGATESLQIAIPLIKHALKMARGEKH
jgi:cyclic pyranopterin phosphate synthase